MVTPQVTDDDQITDQRLINRPAGTHRLLDIDAAEKRLVDRPARRQTLYVDYPYAAVMPYLNLNLHFELLSRLTMRHGAVNDILHNARDCLRQAGWKCTRRRAGCHHSDIRDTAPRGSRPE